MNYSVAGPQHISCFLKSENTEQDLKSSLMTQGYHYGKQVQNDGISQGLRWVELPAAAERMAQDHCVL